MSAAAFRPDPASPAKTTSSSSSKVLHEADARLLASRPAQPGSGGHHLQPSVGASLKARLAKADVKRAEWAAVGAVGVLALVVRLWKIWEPSSVVFDEVHFGGFASKYIRHTFFMDVHPPLAKLLITFAAWVGGYQGGVDDFKDIAKEYPSSVPYTTMRLLPALLGATLPVQTYLTLRALALSPLSATLGALLVLFDNALTAQSRLILLDSPLVFFTALTILCWCRFSNVDQARPFSRSWWKWLGASGLSLGAVASCKWVGLFTIATLGLSTVAQLWALLGDLRVSPRVWLRHFAARALGLIVLPCVVYLACFRVHFALLGASGEGDGFMSSAFQHTLRGHGMDDTFAEVAYGSTISIRHLNTQGGYLHSHLHNYPGGSKQQQITLYPHRDANNDFQVLNVSSTSTIVPLDWSLESPVFLKDGDQIRLEHVSSLKRVHSHDVRPPISEVDFQNEVSGYGFEGFEGDANDIFVVELSRSSSRRARQNVLTLRSHIRFRHLLTGCYLFSHKIKLPDWGFEQQEVTCNKNPTLDNSLWYIETNSHPLLPPTAEKVNYIKPGFLAKFLELQAVMWHTNAGLTDRHSYDSRPSAWPLMRRGINFWVKDHKQIYLIGNPFVWWTSTLAVGAYVAVRAAMFVRAKRGYRDLHHPLVTTYDANLGFLFTAWALHYFPFYLMQRQLFLHHYLPALYFSVLLLTVVFEAATSRVRPRTRAAAAAVVLLLALYGFARFSNFTYGRPSTKALCEKAKWRKNWDFSCADFHDDLSQYSPPQGGLLKPIESLPVGGGDAAETTATEQHVAPVEAGPNAFEHKAVPVYDAQAAVALEQGNDPNVPKHGDAGDLATGAAAGVPADSPPPALTELAGQVPEHQPPPPAAPPAEALEIDADARRLIEQALRNEIADEEARLREAQGVKDAQEAEEEAAVAGAD